MGEQQPTCARICLMKSTMSSVASRKMLTCKDKEAEQQRDDKYRGETTV